MLPPRPLAGSCGPSPFRPGILNLRSRILDPSNPSMLRPLKPLKLFDLVDIAAWKRRDPHLLSSRLRRPVTAALTPSPPSKLRMPPPTWRSSRMSHRSTHSAQNTTPNEVQVRSLSAEHRAQRRARPNGSESERRARPNGSESEHESQRRMESGAGPSRVPSGLHQRQCRRYGR